MIENHSTIDFKAKQEKKYRERISVLLDILPSYCKGFQQSMKARSCTLHTCVQYLNDVHTFFRFLAENNPLIKVIGIKDVDLHTLEILTGDDFDEYINWLSAYQFNPEDAKEKEKTNKNSTKRRKLVSLRLFFRYLYVRNKIDCNPMEKASVPRAERKYTSSIRILDDNELNLFLTSFDDAYEDAVTKSFIATDEDIQKDKYTKMRPAMIMRDRAIVHLILNTGLRVSELCAINCADISWKTGKINVIRKEDEDGGAKSNFVCINESMMTMLNEYIEDSRPLLAPNDTNYDALFIGSKHSRITPRSIERMVKEYANLALGAKHGITPHKLRATFGSRYYRATNDITATAYALNHMSGIEVAARYYLHPKDDALEQAATLNLVPEPERKEGYPQ